MDASETTSTIRTLDGLHLEGTFLTPTPAPSRGVVLVHGAGVTREEGGFFSRLAEGVARAGVASLRFDLRGHGQSQGDQKEVTLSAHLNDIQVALSELRAVTGAEALSLLGASFGGGLAAYYAAGRPAEVTRLVLLNPQLDYKASYIDNNAHWSDDYLDDTAARTLAEQGYLERRPGVYHGRALLNEVFWLRPVVVLGEIVAPTLIVHGTQDTFIPVEASRSAVKQLRAEHQLIEIEGAQHGFAVHDDPTYAEPQSQQWQADVIRSASEWLAADSAR